MEQSLHSRPLDQITDSLVAWCSISTQLVAHMAASPDPPPSDDEITRSLVALLRPSLEPLSERHAAQDIEATAAVLRDAIDTLQDEILLVPHPNREARRRRKRGRR